MVGEIPEVRVRPKFSYAVERRKLSIKSKAILCSWIKKTREFSNDCLRGEIETDNIVFYPHYCLHNYREQRWNLRSNLLFQIKWISSLKYLILLVMLNKK